jgi:hypothetical protein
MGQTHELFNNHGVPGDTDALSFNRAIDETGIFQIDWNGNGTFTCILQGRTEPNAPWFDVQEFDETSSDDHNDLGATALTIASVITLFPQMRVSTSGFSGSARLGGWLTE